MNIDFSKQWPQTVSEAEKIQEDLIKERNFKNLVDSPKYICGCDVNYSSRSKMVKAACAVFSYPDLKEVEIQTHETETGRLFPYIPGLLACREIPFLLHALKKIKSPVDVFVVDGQGRLHPRGTGMAVHLGVIINKPTIGCARNSLYGTGKEVVNIKGAYSLISSKGAGVIGAKVMTKVETKPLFVSQGWGISLIKAIEITVNCCTSYRSPEVLRAAHRASKLI